jgi:serine/threonine protein kinase
MAKKTRKTKKTRGGRFVQQGSQGCIYSPALRCRGSPGRNPDVLSKLTNEANGQYEMAIRDLLAPIDPTQKYFVYATHMCSVAPEDLDPAENSLAPCNLIGKRFKADLSDAVSVEFPFGGTDLTDFRMSYEDYIPFFTGLASLLEGLVLLHRNNIIHLDIKAENIVAKKQQDGSYQLRFIDFGFMTPVLSYNIRNPPIPLQQLPYWPIDMLFIDSRFKPEFINEKLLERFKKDIEPLVKSALPEPSLFLETTVSEIKELYEASQKYTRDEQLDLILKAADIYSMGILLAQLFFMFTGHKEVNEKISFQTAIPYNPNQTFWKWQDRIAEKIFYPLYELIWEMTLMDFRDRPKAEEVLAQYSKIIPAIQKYFRPEYLSQYLFQ